MQSWPPLHPLQAGYYIVAASSAVGAFYLGIITFRANQRDKRKDTEEREAIRRIKQDSQRVDEALKAAEQAHFIKNLQDRISQLGAELRLIKRRQRRSMGVQFVGALFFLTLLVGLLFYENGINERVMFVTTKAQNASGAANNATETAHKAMDQVTTQRKEVEHAVRAKSRRAKPVAQSQH